MSKSNVASHLLKSRWYEIRQLYALYQRISDMKPILCSNSTYCARIKHIRARRIERILFFLVPRNANIIDGLPAVENSRRECIFHITHYEIYFSVEIDSRRDLRDRTRRLSMCFRAEENLWGVQVRGVKYNFLCKLHFYQLRAVKFLYKRFWTKRRTTIFVKTKVSIASKQGQKETFTVIRNKIPNFLGRLSA